MLMKLKNFAWFTVLLIALAACSQDPADSSTTESADIIITGAKIFTSDKQQPWAEALAIKDGKFIYVGDASGIGSYTSARSVDLQGKLVIPGLTDGHSHPGYVNVEKFGDVEGNTPEELLASVKEYADEHPDEEWLRPCCWPTDMFVQGDEGPRRKYWMLWYRIDLSGLKVQPATIIG